MLEESIKNFAVQFSWTPQVQNAELSKQFNRFVVAGMGGSNIASGFLKSWRPETNLLIHRDYGLPKVSDTDIPKTLVILSSYSGNTEETIDAFHEAGKKGFMRAVISTGGELLKIARDEKVPAVVIPQNKIQPRLAVGFNFMALLKIIGDENALTEAAGLSSLDHVSPEEEGKNLTKKLIGFVPVIYASEANKELAYAWKVVFNETGKIPAFWNVLPELNHNEMTGFDVRESTAPLSKNFYFLILEDKDDNPKILKRAQTLKKLYRERDLNVQVLEMQGNSRLERIFISYLTANWTAYHLALHYGVEPEEVPMVEEFKKLIRE